MLPFRFTVPIFCDTVYFVMVLTFYVIWSSSCCFSGESEEHYRVQVETEASRTGNYDTPGKCQ